VVQKLIIFSLGAYLNVINLLSKKIGGKHAFLVFCYPFSVRLKPAQAAFLKTSRQSILDFEGKKIAVYEWGSGPQTILCLHGLHSQTFRWKKFIEELDFEKYRVVAIDAPGHGKSEGKFLNAIVYARLIEKLLEMYSAEYILAHSLGAFGSLYLFNEKPELSPKKMALLGTPGEVSEFLEAYGKVLKINQRVYDNMHRYIEKTIGKPPSYYSAEKFAKKQTAEGLLIHDTEDVDAPYKHAQSIHRNWENSELFTTTGFGHKLRDISVVEKVVAFFG